MRTVTAPDVAPPHGCAPRTAGLAPLADTHCVLDTVTSARHAPLLPAALRLTSGPHGWVWHSGLCADAGDTCIPCASSLLVVERDDLRSLFRRHISSRLDACPNAGPTVHARILAMRGINALDGVATALDGVTHTRGAGTLGDAAIIGRRLGLLPERTPGMWDHVFPISATLLERAIAVSPEVAGPLAPALEQRDRLRETFTQRAAHLAAMTVTPWHYERAWVLAPRDALSEGSIAHPSHDFSTVALHTPLHSVLHVGTTPGGMPRTWLAWQVPACYGWQLNGDHGCVDAGPVLEGPGEELAVATALAAWDRSTEVELALWHRNAPLVDRLRDELSSSLKQLLAATRAAVTTAP